MEVRAGYKQTEVGVIPKDWAVESVQKIGHIKTGPFGTLLKASEYSVGEGTPLICMRDIGEGTLQVDGQTPLVPQSVVKKMPEYLLNSGDIVFGRKGAINRSALVNENQSGWFLGTDGIRIRPTKNFHPPFISYQFQRTEIQSWLLRHATGTTMPSLNPEMLRLLSLPFPSLSEQRTIATALSDTDAQISSLEQIIAKKRDLKQAAMQELLTGKRRLPRFNGEWSRSSLIGVCWFQEGPGVRDSQFTHTGVKLLNGTNIFRGDIFLDNTDRFISENEAFGPYSHFLAKAGDIVIASSGIAIEKFHEKVAFVHESHLPLCMNTSTIRFRTFGNKLNTNFLYYFLMSNSFKNQIGVEATGSAQLNFGPSHVAKVVMLLPTLDEQHAIATVLSDMDAELTALEQQRDKTKAIKQGMMQELLTGRIRLV